jgi:fucose 4-O-acetylase-like acetyltransferase
MLKTRIQELDYLKSIFIILMVMFHLVYFGDKYPYAKELVYTFHMSAFLILSGYLVNINKDFKSFFRMLLWIFIPYVIMESGYVVMASILPIREHIDGLNIKIVLEKIFKEPLGPYWYFHTIIICDVFYYAIYKLDVGKTELSNFIVLGLSLFLVSCSPLNLLSFENAMYFLIGVWVKRRSKTFLSFFQPSLLSIIPLIVLCCYSQNLNRALLSGVVITYLVVSLLLALYRYIPSSVKNVTNYIGRNTLVILLFSPIFTILSKLFIPVFAFDPTGICFICVAVAFSIAGCFLVSYIMDRIHLSIFFFGKKQILE